MHDTVAVALVGAAVGWRRLGMQAAAGGNAADRIGG
jgi:hypothetical protein